MDRLVADGAPFFLFLRHMDPHAPYLPPYPFEACSTTRRVVTRLIAPWSLFSRSSRSANFFAYLDAARRDRQGLRHIAQYDARGLYGTPPSSPSLPRWRPTASSMTPIVVINSDHGDDLYDHECYFDHPWPLRTRRSTCPWPSAIRGPSLRACESRDILSTRTCCRPCWSWPHRTEGLHLDGRSLLPWSVARSPLTRRVLQSPNAKAASRTRASRGRFRPTAGGDIDLVGYVRVLHENATAGRWNLRSSAPRTIVVAVRRHTPPRRAATCRPACRHCGAR
jgi:hypothetical protein